MDAKVKHKMCFPFALWIYVVVFAHVLQCPRVLSGAQHGFASAVFGKLVVLQHWLHVAARNLECWPSESRSRHGHIFCVASADDYFCGSNWQPQIALQNWFPLHCLASGEIVIQPQTQQIGASSLSGAREPNLSIYDSLQADNDDDDEPSPRPDDEITPSSQIPFHNLVVSRSVH